MPTRPSAAPAASRLAAPHIVTELPGPRARALIARDQRTVSPSLTRAYPLVAESGSGYTVTDVDGNRFLDFAAGIAVVSTGHSHPAVVAAISEQAQRLIHIAATDFYEPRYVEFSEKLAAIAPFREPARVFLTNSGTEAVEGAIKLARFHTGRPGIIAFEGGFHGRTMGALSLTNSKIRQRAGFGPLLPMVEHAPFPRVRSWLAKYELVEAFGKVMGVDKFDGLSGEVSFIEVSFYELRKMNGADLSNGLQHLAGVCRRIRVLRRSGVVQARQWTALGAAEHL